MNTPFDKKERLSYAYSEPRDALPHPRRRPLRRHLQNPSPSGRRSGAKRGKFDFQEQTYKLPKLLQLMGELTRKNFILGKELKNKEITIYCQSPVSIPRRIESLSRLSAHKPAW